ncbi:MAG: protein kinase [Elusimicrobia bacterium]|nr:protein kinase [Elusimicrobiota bacterium]
MASLCPGARAECGVCEQPYHDHANNKVQCVPIPNCKPTGVDATGTGTGTASETPVQAAIGTGKKVVAGFGGSVQTQAVQGAQGGTAATGFAQGLTAGGGDALVGGDGGDFNAAVMLTPEDALNRLHARQQMWQSQYGTTMNGKYEVLIRSAARDLETWTQKQGENGIDQGTYMRAMGLLNSQIGLAYWAEVPGIEPAQRQAEIDRISARVGRFHDELPADVMEVVHKAYDEGVKAASNVPTTKPGQPNTPGTNPNAGGGFPGGGLPTRPMIDQMLRTDPKSPSNWVWSARESLSKGDKAAGLSALDNAIKAGGNAESFALRGGLRLDDKDFNGAYQDAKKALELNPGDKNALGILKSAEGRTSPGVASGPGGSGAAGGAYANRAPAGFAAGGFDTGRPREIAGMTSPAVLSSNQKLDEARRALNMGDLQAALALAQRALELNPANSAAHNLMSYVYSRLRDYPRAIASASAGLALEPRNAVLLNNKAYAQNHAKRYRDGLETSTHAIEADSRNAYSYANRAYSYGGLGDKQAMLADIDQAAALDPAFKGAAAQASELQLPSNADILFMFPGEDPAAAVPAGPARGKSFGVVVGAGILGGLLLALGLLSTVLAPLKDSVVSAFTKATRRGPSVHALEEDSTPASASPAEASGVIRGQYEIVRQIGAGGMGMVYEGTDRSLGRRVAIKKMRDELRVNPRERERFVIEAKTVASLRHPNIVDIYAIAEEGDDVYLVFEYVDGKTIHDLVQSQGRLNRADAVRATSAMGEALTYAHAHGVIHRDMKPSNKVMDFGIARMAKDALTRYSMTNTVVGTPPYMAPEQEQGVVRKESDVYALAICSYEMLTGKLPFIGVAAGMLMNKINMSYILPSRAIAGLPASIDEVFLKAFQADPDQRYRTPKEFADALEAAFGGARSSRPV